MTGTAVKNAAAIVSTMTPNTAKSAKGAAVSGGFDFQSVWNSQMGKNAQNGVKTQNPAPKPVSNSEESGSEKLEQPAADRGNVGPNKEQETVEMETQKSAADERQSVKTDKVSGEQPEQAGELSSEELETAMEALGAAAVELMQEIADTFGIPMEELQSALDELGMEPVDLLQPAGMGQIALKLGGAEDSFALLTDETLCDKYKALMEQMTEVLNETAEDLKIDPKQLETLLNNGEQIPEEPDEQTVPGEKVFVQEAPEEKVSVQEVPAEKVSVQEAPEEKVSVQEVPEEKVFAQEVPEEKVFAQAVPDGEIFAQEVPAEKVSVQEVPAEKILVQAAPEEKVSEETVPKETVPKEMVSVRKVPDRAEETGLREDGVQKASDALTEDRFGAEVNKPDGAGDKRNGEKQPEQDSDGGQSGNLFAQEFKPLQPETGAQQTQSVAQSALPDADTQDIMRQIMDYMKLQLNAETTNLEMHLHPESLGTLHVQVEAKAGVITASFITQNEAVKAALESQIVQLKENFEEQGVKVEAIEVMVESHAFERNLEQGREQNQGSHEPSKKARVRRINLNDLSAMEDMEEEDALAADMLAAGGSTVDYTA